MGSSHLTLSFDLGSLDPQAAETACFELGAQAVTFVDAHDDPVLEPLPGELRLWTQTRLSALFEQPHDAGELARRLAARLALATHLIRAELVADRAWEREWLKDFHAVRFGRRLWVCPHHERVGDTRAVVVKLDPGSPSAPGRTRAPPCASNGSMRTCPGHRCASSTTAAARGFWRSLPQSSAQARWTASISTPRRSPPRAKTPAPTTSAAWCAFTRQPRRSPGGRPAARQHPVAAPVRARAAVRGPGRRGAADRARRTHAARGVRGDSRLCCVV